MSFTQYPFTLDESHEHLILKLDSRLSCGIGIVALASKGKRRFRTTTYYLRNFYLENPRLRFTKLLDYSDIISIVPGIY